MCIELAKNKLDVTYCDIGEQLSNFAKWRFEKKRLPVKMVAGIENLDNEIYDCIFSFDAFVVKEHLAYFAAWRETFVFISIFIISRQAAKQANKYIE